MAILAYARVSSSDQSTASQIPDLEAAGATRVFTDTVSGVVPPAERGGMQELLAFAREGDELVVWRLDRIGRNAAAVLALVEDLDQRGITLRTLDGITTVGPTGRLVLTILAAVSEMERVVIRERVSAGIAARKAAGLPTGRPRALTPEQVELARLLIGSGGSRATVARQLGVSKATIVRAAIGLGRES